MLPEGNCQHGGRWSSGTRVTAAGLGDAQTRLWGPTPEAGLVGLPSLLLGLWSGCAMWWRTGEVGFRP